MFIELVDVLRCPRPHEESWLVLSTTRMHDRHVVEGELGCPICRAHYLIRRGVVHFSDVARSEDTASEAPPGDAPPGMETAMRMAALLGLAEPGGIVMLAGQHAGVAESLAVIAGNTQLVCLTPPTASVDAESVSSITSAAPLPLSTASCRSVAADARHADPTYLSEMVRVLRAGGRLVAPANAMLPDGVREIARDTHEWVAERTAAPGPLISIAGSRRK